MTACFENFLVPQESLISWNIIFKRQRFINVLESFSYKDSLFILDIQVKKVLFNDKLVIFIIFFHVWA
jgi:hypothetical protein